MSKVSPCVVVEFHMRSRVRVSLAHVILKLYPYYVYIDKLCIRHLSRAFLELDYRGVRVAVLVSGFGPITNITVVPGGLNLTYLVNSTSCVLGLNITFLDAEYSGLGSQVVDVVDLGKVEVGYGRILRIENMRLYGRADVVSFVLDADNKIRELDKKNNVVEMSV